MTILMMNSMMNLNHIYSLMVIMNWFVKPLDEVKEVTVSLSNNILEGEIIGLSSNVILDFLVDKKVIAYETDRREDI